MKKKRNRKQGVNYIAFCWTIVGVKVIKMKWTKTCFKLMAQCKKVSDPGFEQTNHSSYEWFYLTGMGSSINDVTRFWTIFDTPPPIITNYITKSSVMLSQNHWTLPLRLWRHLWTTPNNLVWSTKIRTPKTVKVKLK